jgi:arylsulfatase A
VEGINKFLMEQKDDGNPFLLYVPFMHVHNAAPNLVDDQYSQCQFRNVSARGGWGDALLELDWSVGQITATLQELGLYNNTLILFTSDNGPWLSTGEDAGSVGPFTAKAGTFQ